MGRIMNIKGKLQSRFILFYFALSICTLLVLVGSFRWLQQNVFKRPKCWDIHGDLFDVHKLQRTEPAPLIYPGEPLPDLSRYDFSFNLLPRVSTARTKQNLFALLRDFLYMLEENDIEHFMSQGTLLGSFFFHDIIPWDDDIDLFVHIKHVNKLRALFRSEAFKKYYEAHTFHDPVNMYGQDILHEDIPESNTFTCGTQNPDLICYQQGKIYLKNSSHAGKYEWRYPFVDFIFYGTNETHMINHELWTRDGKIEITLSDFYPFQLRPFNRVWIPAPREPLRFLRSKFSQFFCKQSYWNHTLEHRAYNGWPLQVDCPRTAMCYAHVRRRRATQRETEVWIQKRSADRGMQDKLKNSDVEVRDQVVEELVLGDAILQSVFLDEPFEGELEFVLYSS